MEERKEGELEERMEGWCSTMPGSEGRVGGGHVRSQCECGRKNRIRSGRDGMLSVFPM